jgi:hypothetical protein
MSLALADAAELYNDLLRSDARALAPIACGPGRMIGTRTVTINWFCSKAGDWPSLVARQ